MKYWVCTVHPWYVPEKAAQSVTDTVLCHCSPCLVFSLRSIWHVPKLVLSVLWTEDVSLAWLPSFHGQSDHTCNFITRDEEENIYEHHMFVAVGDV